MNPLEIFGLRFLHRFDPEVAHGLSLFALRSGLVPMAGIFTTPRLVTRIAGLDFANPVGLAAGYDKNAQALGALTRAGFGFVEVGAATPLPQPGNPKPRLFRLTEDRAAINRFGFNNHGMGTIGERLARHRRGLVPIGLNLGANKTSADRSADFSLVLSDCGPYVDFATVNVSSPNTEKLRDLQGRAALSALLSGVMETNAGMSRPLPIFLKISPDLTDEELAEVAEVALSHQISAIVATNTTVSRDGLKNEHRGQLGGLSGAPLFEKSTRILAKLSKLTEGRLPLIGVGGVSTAEEAWIKVQAGASAVQLYTAMVYKGMSIASDIAKGLDAILEREGFASVAAAVGSGRARWL